MGRDSGHSRSQEAQEDELERATKKERSIEAVGGTHRGERPERGYRTDAEARKPSELRVPHIAKSGEAMSELLHDETGSDGAFTEERGEDEQL